MMSTEKLNELYTEWCASKSDDTLDEIRTNLYYLGKTALRGTKIGSAYGVLEDTVSDLLAELICGTSEFDAEKSLFSTYCYNRIDWRLRENRRSPDTRAESIQQRMAQKSEDSYTGESVASEWEPTASVHSIGFDRDEHIPETLTEAERTYVDLIVNEEADEEWEIRRKPKNIAKVPLKVSDQEIAKKMGITTKAANRIRQNVKEKFKQHQETAPLQRPLKRPTYSLGKGTAILYPTWEQWLELISNVFPGLA